MNVEGDVVFAATTSVALDGVFLWDRGTQTVGKIVLEGEPTPAGGTYSFDIGSMPLGIGRGQLISFASTLAGAVSSDALFRVDGGVVSVIAVQGDPALNGGIFAFFNLGTTMHVERRVGMVAAQLSLDGAEYEQFGLVFR
jgi:hypothetical protein